MTIFILSPSEMVFPSSPRSDFFSHILVPLAAVRYFLTVTLNAKLRTLLDT